MLAHAYRWDRTPPEAARFAETTVTVPDGIRRPWSALGRELDLPRVGTMWSMILCNWRLRAGTHGGVPRLSTGTGAPLLASTPGAEDPAARFERPMRERTAETVDALVPGAGEAPAARIPEVSFRFLDRRHLGAGSDVLDRLDGEAVQATLASDVTLAAGLYRSLAVLVARRLNEPDGLAGWMLPEQPGTGPAPRDADGSARLG